MKNTLKNILFLIGLLMVFAGKIYAQNLSNENVARYMEEARKEFNIPAMAVVAFNSDSIIVKEIQGVRVVTANDAAQLSDYFHIGSCSKSILSVIVGKMVEEGVLSWKTKFFDIYPELKNIARQAYHDITLEDLLLCRAGIQPFTSYNELCGVEAKSISSRHAFIKYLIQQTPASQHTDNGFEHLYSNPSYTMAAAMLERITGLTWEELIRNMLQRDLGLSVVFGWPNVFDQDQPWGHTKITDKPYDEWLKQHGTIPEIHSLPDKNVLLAFAPDHEFKLPDIIAPAGDLSMKPLDYAKYAQLHLQGLQGDDNYIKTDTYKTIHYRYQGFSLGVANATSWGEKFSSFDGSAGTFYCSTLLCPDSDFGFVIMINAGSQEAIKGLQWVAQKLLKEYFNLWWMFWM